MKRHDVTAAICKGQVVVRAREQLSCAKRTLANLLS
jgi:hypothetical protein